MLHETRDTLKHSKISLIRRVLGEDVPADYSIAGFYGVRAFALAEERMLIAHYGRSDIGTGPLVNRTDGGDGISGVIWSQETLDRRSASLTGRKLSAAHVAAMSEAGKKQDVTPFIEGARRWREGNMDKIVEERRTRWDKPGVRERHIEAMADPDAHTAMSDAMYARLADPAKRKALAAAVRAARAQPVLIETVLYPSIRAAAKALGVHYTTIHDRLRRKVPGYERIE